MIPQITMKDITNEIVEVWLKKNNKKYKKNENF